MASTTKDDRQGEVRKRRRKIPHANTYATRVAIFIDYANISIAARDYCSSGKINFLELRDRLLGFRSLIRAKIYIPYEAGDYWNDFLSVLESMEYEVIPIPIIKHSNGNIKGDSDIAMTVDVMKMLFKSNIDVFVLVSGDGDFVPLVRAIKNEGAKVEVAAISECTSQKLIDVSDKFIDLGLNNAYFLPY